MSQPKPVEIRMLATGVPGLDEILGGGIPELSFNLIAGGPGTGKTTLAHQFVFANATVAKPALIFTVLGEPTLKLLRYQQQYTFFDATALDGRVRLVNLGLEAETHDLERVLARIVAEVEASDPGFVVVDSFRTVVSDERAETIGFDSFVQKLAVHLTTWRVTSFLLGEYRALDIHDPVFTVADGCLYLEQARDRNSVVRKVQVVKSCGAAQMPGLHTYRITRDGLHIFPRIRAAGATGVVDRTRLSIGVPALDEMMGGGIPAGDAVLIAGPTGSGKTALTCQFVKASWEADAAVVLVVFEEVPRAYIDRAKRIVDLAEMKAAGKLEIIYLRPLDLSVDETLYEIEQAVVRIGATRVVLDSLSGFEVALAPTFRVDFAESLYRLVRAVIALGITVVLTVETFDESTGIRYRNDSVTFLTDDIIVQRYVEANGRRRTVISVLKMRGSEHSDEVRYYQVTPAGITVGKML